MSVCQLPHSEVAEGTGIEPVTVFIGNCFQNSILVHAGPLPQKRNN